MAVMRDMSKCSAWVEVQFGVVLVCEVWVGMRHGLV